MPLSPQALFRGLVSRLLPGKNVDSQNADVAARFGRYGELDVMSRGATHGAAALEGSYFVARTPTPGTGVSYTVNASFSDTVPFIILFNGNNDGLTQLELDYLKIIVTVAGASGTTLQFAGKIDNGARTPTTNHTTSATPINQLPGGKASLATVLYQNNSTASAIPAATAAAQVAFEASVGGITIVGDEVILKFGKTDAPGSNMGLTAAQATCPGVKVTACPPVIVPPQQSLTLYCWMANNALTALSYSFELGWIEK